MAEEERTETLELNFLLLTYDSCRHDVLLSAETPVLDSYARAVPAQAPGNFTFSSHQAFFVGFLPNATEDIPYYNRFRKQLLGLVDVGEPQVAKDSLPADTSAKKVVA